MSEVTRNKKRKIQPKLLCEYLDYLKDCLNLSTATINVRRLYVRGFLSEISEIAAPSKIHRLSPKIIHDYIVGTTKPMTRVKKKTHNNIAALFLKVCICKGVS